MPEYKLPPLSAPAFKAPSDDPASWIRPVEGSPLEFGAARQARDVTLVPSNSLFDERYAIYRKVERA